MAKIQIDVEIENDESKETMALECPYEGNDAEVVEASQSLKKAHDTMSLLQTLQKILAPGTALYDHFLDVFCWKAHDKAGWHSAQVYIKSISVDGDRWDVDVDALDESDQAGMYTLQLVRGTFCGSCHAVENRSMYFLS